MIEKESEEPTLKKLVEELISLANSKDIRYQILVLQLYVEHYVNEIVIEQVKESAKEEIKEHLTIPQKLRILKNLGTINDDIESVLLNLNKIRNVLVHNLIFSVEEINKKLESVNLGFKYAWSLYGKDIPERTKEIDLKKAFKDYKGKIIKHNQLSISCAVIIGILHHRLMSLRGRKTKEIIDVEFRTNEKKELLADIRAYVIN